MFKTKNGEFRFECAANERRFDRTFKAFSSPNRYIIISDVRYTSIYLNIYFIEYRDTILAFGYIDTLAWTA